jgi:hypothetical protein
MDWIQLAHVNTIMNLRVSEMAAISLISGSLSFHQQGHFFVELIHIADLFSPLFKIFFMCRKELFIIIIQFSSLLLICDHDTVRSIRLQGQQRKTTESTSNDNLQAKALRKEIKRISYKRHQTNNNNNNNNTVM